jgi:tetratricopeptide (TPR) repeat protein
MEGGRRAMKIPNGKPGRLLSILFCVALVGPLLSVGVRAGDTTKVDGDITDETGQPLEKVEILFENAKIKGKTTGPVKTNKKGHYVHPTVDIGIEGEWKVVPKLPGYMILRVTWKLVDSQRNDRGSGDQLVNAKQEVPVIKPVPVGGDGVNKVDFVMVKEANFANALRDAVAKQKGGTVGGAESAAAAGTPAGAAGAASAPTSAPGKTVGEALEMMKAGKNEEAIPILKDYADKNPNNAPVQFTLGKALVLTKKYDEAVPPLTKALSVNPNLAGAHFYLGIAHTEMGRDEEAIKEFQAEIPISPEQDAAYSNLASLYEKQGKLDPALENYKKAVEINPGRAELHASLASVYEKKGDQASASAEYKALAEIDPAHAAITWFNVGAIAKNNDKNPDAVRAFKKALELDPGYAAAHRELGYALVKQGDFSEAVAHFKKYLELAPGASDAADIKAMVAQLSK